MAETVAPFEDADAASELTEQEFVRALRMAALVGIPALFAVLALMTALAVGGKAGFYAGALWPAIVGGPFFAGFAYLTWEVSRHEAAHHHAGTRRAGRPAH